MKRSFLTLCILALALVCSLCLWPTAKAASVDDLTFTLNNDGLSYTVSDCNTSASGDLEIPAIYNGKPVTGIGSYAFYNCKSLISITIPGSITTIGSGRAFEYCTSLSAVHISDLAAWCRISFGNDYANPMRYAKNLYINGVLATDITIPSSVTTIGDYVFYYCSSLTSVSIPNTATTIGEWAFYNCSNLTSVTIPDSITTIGNHAFSFCSNLTSVTIPSSVIAIGDSAFSICSSLTGIWVDAKNPAFCSDDKGVLFSKEKSRLILAPAKLSGAYTIPDSVTSIDYHAFYMCNSLQYNIHGNGKYLGNATNPYMVLMEATSESITSCQIHNATKIIADRAFFGCRSLTSVTIPDSVTTIGPWAFGYCRSLTSVSIPDSVTTIGDSAFSVCSSLTSVTIPNSVTTIGSTAFYDCSKLTTVIIGDSVTSIGDLAFGDCSSLTSVTIPNSITNIGLSVFSNCSSIQYNLYGNGMYLGNATNSYLLLMDTTSTSITSIQIHNATKIIGYDAFLSCRSLKSVTIPDSVTAIGFDAFAYCSNLTAVTIPDSVANIGEYAFYGCDSLVDAYYEGTKTQWDAISIGAYNTNLTNAVKFLGFEILSHPKEQSVLEGENAQFTVEAGDSNLFYRWQYSKDGGETWINATSAMTGYKSATLTIKGIKARNGYLLRCKVTGKDGNEIFSEAALLTVEDSVTFTAHPAAETVKLGNRAAFTVSAEGEGMVYQWQYQMVENGPWWNCTQYTQGYNTTVLNVIAAEKRQGFLYRCRITDANGNKYYSNTAELTVDIPESYAILSQPKTAYVMPGSTTTFHIETQGEGLTYQWEYHKGVDKSGPEYYWIAMSSTTGCKTDTLTIAGISGSTNRDGWAYRCVVTDSNGYIYTTDYAFLYVTTAQIDTQPENVNAVLGTNAVFTVETSGEVASYQWQYSKDGGKSWYHSSSATQGYNTDTLTVGATAARNGFLYRCKLTDSEGNLLITDPAQLIVE